MNTDLPAIGIFGGSFDPVHTAHLRWMETFATTLGLDEVRLVPAAQPWQKGKLKASATERVAMLELAVASLAPHGWSVVIDRREIARGGASYTIDTLIEMRAEAGPHALLVLLMGADQFVRLHTWHRWLELFDFAHVAVATRPGSVLTDLPAAVERQWQMRNIDCRALRQRQAAGPAGRICMLDQLELDLSATMLRDMLKRGGTHAALAPGLLPRPVLDYIEQNNLYKD